MPRSGSAKFAKNLVCNQFPFFFSNNAFAGTDTILSYKKFLKMQSLSFGLILLFLTLATIPEHILPWSASRKQKKQRIPVSIRGETELPVVLSLRFLLYCFSVSSYGGGCKGPGKQKHKDIRHRHSPPPANGVPQPISDNSSTKQTNENLLFCYAGGGCETQRKTRPLSSSGFYRQSWDV